MEETRHPPEPPQRPNMVRRAFAHRRDTWRRSRAIFTGDMLIVIGLLAVAFLGVQDWRYLDFDEALAEVREDNPSAVLDVDPATGSVSVISNLEVSTATGSAMGADPGSASRFVQQFVERPEVAKVLALETTRAQLRLGQRFRDPQRPEYSVLKFQQFVENVKVFGADVVVSLRGGQNAAISSVAAAAAEVPQIDMSPQVDEQSVRTAATEFYASLRRDPRMRLPPDQPVTDVELVIFDPARFRLSGNATLAWRTRVGTVEMFIDANNRGVLTAYDLRHSLLNRLTHDCANAAKCALVLNEQGVVSPKPPPVKDALEGHRLAGIAHGYFRTMFGRDGYDDVSGEGGKMPLELYVRVPDLSGAQWHPELKRLEFAPGWVTLDIAAHEYAHGVSQFAADLIYLGESGAVSEFLSDFFGAMIEGHATGSTDWLIGEGISGFSVKQPLRNMSQPHTNGFDRTKDPDPKTNGGQPEHFDELVTSKDRICAFDPLKDNECVHFNSGILNKAAVLASDGGTFRGVAVTGISRRKLEQIVFRTMTFLPRTPGLKETANLAVVACTQLVGVGTYGITENDCTSLGQAFTAVGLR